MEPREVLREGDGLLKNGDPVGAIHEYQKVARHYAEQGFWLKAVAIWKQIRDIVRTQAPDEIATDKKARAALVELYRGLGLMHDAEAVENEPPLPRKLDS